MSSARLLVWILSVRVTRDGAGEIGQNRQDLKSSLVILKLLTSDLLRGSKKIDHKPCGAAPAFHVERNSASRAFNFGICSKGGNEECCDVRLS